MGENPKDSMGEAKEIRKDNANEMIKNVTRHMRDDASMQKSSDTTQDVTNKATSMAKRAKDKVVGTMEEAKKKVEGYVGGVLRPTEVHRDKDVDQTEIDVERRPLDEKYP